MQRIYVKWGVTGKLAEKFKCSYQTVRNALRGASESELAEKIREEALGLGGFVRFPENEQR